MGTKTPYGGTEDGLSLSAGIFNGYSAAPDGTSFIGAGVGGIPMSLSFTAYPYSGAGYTVVTVGNQSTDILTGSIIFTTGTFTVSQSELTTGQFTTSVDVVGTVMAFQDVGGGQGPSLATLSFAGKGNVTLYPQDYGDGYFAIVIGIGRFSNISGNLTVVPEPSSIFLMSSGLGFLGTLARKYSHHLGRNCPANI